MLLGLLVLTFLAGGLFLADGGSEGRAIDWLDVAVPTLEVPVGLARSKAAAASNARRSLDPEKSSGLLSGTVVIRSAGKDLPASGASIYWATAKAGVRPPESRIEDLPVIEADASGAFAASIADGETVYALVSHPYGVSKLVSSVLPALEIKIVLEPASRLIVHAEGFDGPFAVIVNPKSAATQGRSGRQRLRFMGKRGTCVCNGIPATWKTVSVMARSLGKDELVATKSADVRFRRDVHVYLGAAQAAAVIGRIQDEQGQPVAEAEVYLYEMFPGMQSTFQESRTRSDDTGAFKLTGVPNGKMNIRWHKQGFAYEVKMITVTGAGAMELGNLVLRRGLSVSGRVVGYVPGGPFTHVGILQIGMLSDVFLTSKVGKSIDPDGTFSFDHIRPGRYLVIAAPSPTQGIRSAWFGTKILVQKDKERVDLTVSDSRIWDGLLVGSDLQSHVGAGVILRGIQTPWASFAKIMEGGRILASVREFPFLLGLGSHRSDGGWGGVRWVAIVQPAVKSVRLPASGIRFRTVESPRGHPNSLALTYLENHRLQSTLPLKASAPRMPKDALDYKIDGLSPGRYRLTAYWPNRHSRDWELEVKRGNQSSSYDWPF